MDAIQTSALKKKGLRRAPFEQYPPRPNSNVRPVDSHFRGNDGLKETIHLSFIRNQVGRCAVLHPRDVRSVFPPGMNPSSFPGRSARAALSARQWSTARISKGPDTEGSLPTGCLPVVFMSARRFVTRGWPRPARTQAWRPAEAEVERGRGRRTADRSPRDRGRECAARRVAGLHAGDAGAAIPEAMVRRPRLPSTRSAPPDPGPGPDVRDLGVITSAVDGGCTATRPGNGTKQG